VPRVAGTTHDGALGVPDPAAVSGTPEQIERAFREAFVVLDRRINLLLCLPLASLGSLAIQKEIDRIGKTLPDLKAQGA
jgi:arsenate reductase (thioredoxin)